MNSSRKYDLEERLIDFSILIIDVVESLPDNRIYNHLAGQLIRSGTSPALNYGEAQSAESRKDFVHKLRVVLKELRETSINLQILSKKSMLGNAKALKENNELVAIFTKSIVTAKAAGER